MSWKAEFLIQAAIATLLVGGAASVAPAGEEPEAPASSCAGESPPALAAPAGNEFAFELLAEGVQVYSCDAAASGPAWAFDAPEARLFDRHGQLAATHRAGPTWAAVDGSSVLGAKLEAATPDPAAIPWLLLRAASHHGGRGRMADVTYVQRVQTSGGVAPREGCNEASLGLVARVPYRAVYCFYRGRGVRPDGDSPRL